MSVVPESYEEWKRCITIDCAIPLTRDFVKERIAALEDMNDFHTLRYIESWGKDQHARTLAWYRRAEDELRS
tara:strand:- start:931 stop:1146 length:216 start_codon:yes stop_codon:yes gene_type:complete